LTGTVLVTVCEKWIMFDNHKVSGTSLSE